MNYEELYETLTVSEKKLSDALKELAKQNKILKADTENGDLKDMDKALGAFKKAFDNARASYKEIREAVDAFDRNAYVTSGQFARQLLKECEEKDMDVRELGGNSYEMFPNKVTISDETLDTTVDKKKYSYLRPQALAKKIQEDQAKLKKEKFNEERFLNELAEAYDVVLLKSGKKSASASVKLNDVYLRLAPTARAKKEYTKQAYAFDLARLWASNVRETKDGRRLDLGTMHDKPIGIRVLNQNGKEEYYATISFI